MRIAVVALIAACLAAPAFAQAKEPRVVTASGPVVGAISAGVASFKGIPYAAPPVGALRWRPPQPVAVWQGTREANRSSPICVQPSPIPGSFYQRELFQIADRIVVMSAGRIVGDFPVGEARLATIGLLMAGGGTEDAA